jgi:hypothetical protein
VRWLVQQGHTAAEIAACVAEVRHEPVPPDAAERGMELVCEAEVCFGSGHGSLSPNKN